MLTGAAVRTWQDDEGGPAQYPPKSLILGRQCTDITDVTVAPYLWEKGRIEELRPWEHVHEFECRPLWYRFRDSKTLAAFISQPAFLESAPNSPRKGEAASNPPENHPGNYLGNYKANTSRESGISPCKCKD